MERQAPLLSSRHDHWHACAHEMEELALALADDLGTLRTFLIQVLYCTWLKEDANTLSASGGKASEYIRAIRTADATQSVFRLSHLLYLLIWLLSFSKRCKLRQLAVEAATAATTIADKTIIERQCGVSILIRWLRKSKSISNRTGWLEAVALSLI